MNRPHPRGDLRVVAALRTEYLAMCGHGLRLERCGMGEARAARWASAHSEPGTAALVLVGVAGGLDPSLHAPDVVLGTEVQDGSSRLVIAAHPDLAAALTRAGLVVRSGPIACSQNLVLNRAERATLHANGALCVDMESAAVARGWRGAAPITVIRVVVDTVQAGLLHPATIPNGIRALRAVRLVATVLRRSALATGPSAD